MIQLECKFCQKPVPYTEDEDILTCPGCDDIVYCSQACLKADSKTHGLSCCKNEQNFYYHLYCEQDISFVWKKFTQSLLTTDKLRKFLKVHTPSHCYVCRTSKPWQEMRVSQYAGLGFTGNKLMDHYIWIAFTCSTPKCVKQACILVRKRAKQFEQKSDFDEVFQSCSACGHIEHKMKVCSQCRASFYCNEECQRKDWPTHKFICQGGPKKKEENL